MTQPLPKSRPGLLKRIIFALIPVCLLLGLSEVSLRIAHFSYTPDAAPIIVRDRYFPSFKEIFEFDEHTLYKHRRGAVYRFKQTFAQGGAIKESIYEETLPDTGFRGGDISRKKPDRTFRIAFLGDSATFGFHVPLQYIFTETVEKNLDRRFRSRSVQTINAGAVGYTSTQGVNHFRENVLPYQPDVAVVMFGAVNETFAMDMTDAQRMESLARNSRPAALRRTLLRLRTAQLLLRTWRGMSKKRGPEKTTTRVPPEQFRRDLAAFVDIANRNHIALVFMLPVRRDDLAMAHPAPNPYDTAMRQAADRYNIPLIDLPAAFRKPAGTKVLMLDNVHPSPAGHAVIAKQLAAAIIVPEMKQPTKNR